MKANGSKAKKMDQDCIYLQMETFIKANFKMEIDKVKVVILGLTKVIIKGNGLQIK